MTPSTIFHALRRDHDLQRELICQLMLTEGDSPLRRQLYARLRQELAAHAAAEERCFYARLMQHDLTLGTSRHGVAEHHELDELVARLDETDMGSSGWLNRARHLFERVEHHLAEEERSVFQLAGKVMAEQQKLDLAADYVDAMHRQRERQAA